MSTVLCNDAHGRYMCQIITQINEQWRLHSNSLCRLYHRPPICHVKYRCQGITQKKEYNIQTRVKVWNQKYYMLVLTTMKMPAWVAETCWWLLCNKITFINPSAFVGLFNKCHTNVTILGGHDRTHGAPGWPWPYPWCTWGAMTVPVVHLGGHDHTHGAPGGPWPYPWCTWGAMTIPVAHLILSYESRL